MRLQFIHPIYLPSLSEQFLRKDFNFASYLSLAYSKTLQSFFNTTWLSLLLLLFLLDTSSLLILTHQLTSDPHSLLPMLVNLVPPILFLGVYLSFRSYFARIESKLHPQIRRDHSDGTYIRPEEINVHINYDVVDPFALYDNIPQPEYLEIRGYEDQMQAYEDEKMAKSPRDKGKGKQKELEQDEEESQILDDNESSRRSQASINLHSIKSQGISY